MESVAPPRPDLGEFQAVSSPTASKWSAANAMLVFLAALGALSLWQTLLFASCSRSAKREGGRDRVDYRRVGPPPRRGHLWCAALRSTRCRFGARDSVAAIDRHKP